MGKKRKSTEYKKYKNTKQRKNKMDNTRKCQYCGCDMRHRGAGDAAGGYSWKCRNKECGRTVWKRRKVVAPEPVVPTNLINKNNILF